MHCITQYHSDISCNRCVDVKHSIIDLVELEFRIFSSRKNCGMCVSQLIRFAGVCSGIGGFGSGNLFLAAKLLERGCRYHGIRGAFSEFCYGHSGLVVGYNIGLKALLQ